jgi:hypothetical protein
MNFLNKLEFAPVKPFQPSLLFVGKSYPRVEHLKGVSHFTWASPANTMLSWIGLQRTKTLAYYENS